MTTQELRKQQIIHRLVEKDINGTQAAEMLQLSIRQVKRLKASYKKHGVHGLIHKSRGKPGNRKIHKGAYHHIVSLLKQHYADFKPTFAAEKLSEHHGINVSSETVRNIMIKEGIWKVRKRSNKKQYRQWRERKESYGQMQQFDGSYHNWLEGRDSQHEELCLLASIDDATGRITQLKFEKHEGIDPVFRFWKDYIETTGKPVSIYLDKYSTYKINHKNAVDNHELMTQFQRAMKTLDVRLITAHSPQAKGRVERLFGTLQDRLVKEMRLAQINTKDEANIFVQEVFIPMFNKQFAVKPATVGDIHRILTKIEKQNLNHIFSRHSYRCVNKDFTVRFENKWYQLKQVQKTTVYHHHKVRIEEWLDGIIHIRLNGTDLDYVVLPERPKKMKINPLLITRHKANWTPPKDHPWRQYQQII